MLSSRKLVGLLAEPDRRRVAAALILASGDIEHLVDSTGLDHRAVMAALDRLVGAELVEVGADGTYVLLEEVFKVAARSAADDTAASNGGEPADEDQRIIDRWIVDGKLVGLPSKQGKRLVILDHLAQHFDPGTHYSEREVNQILRAYDDDVATLRRYLVDHQFLDRADDDYWRSGGKVET